jgi:hypothetical protein
MIYHLQS